MNKIQTATSAAPYLSTTLARFQALRVGRGSQLNGKTLDPCTAVRMYCSRICFDPRDKIFGLLSFMSPKIRERLRVDYSTYAGIYDVLIVEGVPSVSGLDCIAGSLGNMLRSIETLLEEFEHSSSQFESDLDAFVDPLRLYEILELPMFPSGSPHISLEIGDAAFIIGEPPIASYVQRDCHIDMHCSHGTCVSALANIIKDTIKILPNIDAQHWNERTYVFTGPAYRGLLQQKSFSCPHPSGEDFGTDRKRMLCIWRTNRDTVAIFSVPREVDLGDYFLSCVDDWRVEGSEDDRSNRILVVIGHQKRDPHGLCVDLVGTARPYYHRGKQWPISDRLPKDITVPLRTLRVMPESLLHVVASPGFSRLTPK